MLEIYREKIRDLLSTKPPPAGGLKMRESPKLGFYGEHTHVEPLNQVKYL